MCDGYILRHIRQMKKQKKLLNKSSMKTTTTLSDNTASIMAQVNEGISLIELLQVVTDNLRLIILAPVTAGLLVLGYGFTIAPTFTATAKILMPRPEANEVFAMYQPLGNLGGSSAWALKYPTDQYLALLQSNKIQDNLADRLKIAERTKAHSRESSRATIAGRTRVSADNNGIITIEVDDNDPQFAAQLANAYIEELDILLIRFGDTEAKHRSAILSRSLDSAQEKMVEAEKALMDSGVDSGVIKKHPQIALRDLSDLKVNIMNNEIKRAGMRGYLTENAPEIKQIQTELFAMLGNLARAEKEDFTRSVTSGGASKISERDYSTKHRDYMYSESMFKQATEQFGIARIAENREGHVIQVLDLATAPEHKNNINRAMMVAFASLSVGLALLPFVFVRQALRGAVQDPQFSEMLLKLRGALAKAVGLA